MTDIYITAAARTPIGAFLGQFAGVPATRLGAKAIEGILQQTSIPPETISEVLMGCVLSANLGQAPARQAALNAGLSQTTDCTTLNKVCGSGMKTIMLGYDLLKAGNSGALIAGGMESMSNAPHLLPASRRGYRYGNFQTIDHMAWDGLTNPYDGLTMGVFAENTAEKYGFTRQDQDRYAAESVRRAQIAQQSGAFKNEIISVDVTTRTGDVEYTEDEPPQKSDIDKIPRLKPAFKKDGTITAASASSIADGAAAVMLMSAAEVARLSVKPLAKIVAHATHSHAPEWFTTAPLGAINTLMDKTGWQIDDVDLFEINEAFAVVAMLPMQVLGIDHQRLNIYGGACALGHPIGASGARIVVTLIHALQQRGGGRGIAALCIGGGEATAIALEVFV